MRKAGVLLWREVEDALSRDIAAGVHSPGSRLPTEGELAVRFGVNRHTVRRALSALQERGAITIEQGRGMFVRTPKLAYPITQRTRYSENLARLSLPLAGRVLRNWEMPATAALARDLQIDEGSLCLAIDDLRDIDGEPISFTTHHFPAARFAGLAEAFIELKSITEALRHFNVTDYTRKLTRVHARPADLEEAAALRIPNGAPALVVEAINVDQDGIPIEYGYTRSAGGRFELIIEAQR
ncbi:phosphonate metabolism transcriptional regulator PhnF [Bradyrhizobium sp. LHD-71]|uniref:phosphonate metabolism transcriptional regulator PhnF n=1 Tax=Bradyrhizobium sp. LHD-71 TaxID=3072141 RepID=UPI00280D1CCC|nr:phosphonate metabolism transcriptional regulator PhnF [Bradyrhizobium sp. LHD-71]MDQ8726834.1 phosphonate metabolism transcriptional regulator PhnF [Bradyrhizobium sp. LHD-71]